MTEAAFWILTVLATGPQHGYGILQAVDDLSRGSARMRVTTAYATLERLEKAGHISKAGEEMVDGRARRYYATTPQGRAALLIETTRLQERLKAAERTMREYPPAEPTRDQGTGAVSK